MWGDVNFLILIDKPWKNNKSVSQSLITPTRLFCNSVEVYAKTYLEYENTNQ